MDREALCKLIQAKHSIPMDPNDPTFVIVTLCEAIIPDLIEGAAGKRGLNESEIHLMARDMARSLAAVLAVQALAIKRAAAAVLGVLVLVVFGLGIAADRWWSPPLRPAVTNCVQAPPPEQGGLAFTCLFALHGPATRTGK